MLGLAFVVGVIQRWNLLAGPWATWTSTRPPPESPPAGFFGSPSVFFPGQPYGGTPETALVAVIHELFGSGTLQLKVVPIVCHLVACLLVWGAARAGRPDAGRAVRRPVLLWLGPAAGGVAVHEGTWLLRCGAGGGGVDRVAGGPTRPSPGPVGTARPRHEALAPARALLTLVWPWVVGWWISPCWSWSPCRRGLALVQMPDVARSTGRGGDRSSRRAVPWLAWNLTHFMSLRQPASLSSDAPGRFGDGVARAAVLLGLETPWDPDRTLVPMARFVTVAILLVAVVVAIQSAPLHRGPASRRRGGGVSDPCTRCWQHRHGRADPRYLCPMLPALRIAVGRTGAVARSIPSVVPVLVVTALRGLHLMGSGRPRRCPLHRRSLPQAPAPVGSSICWKSAVSGSRSPTWPGRDHLRDERAGEGVVVRDSPLRGPRMPDVGRTTR